MRLISGSTGRGPATPLGSLPVSAKYWVYATCAISSGRGTAARGCPRQARWPAPRSRSSAPASGSARCSRRSRLTSARASRRCADSSARVAATTTSSTNASAAPGASPPHRPRANVIRLAIVARRLRPDEPLAEHVLDPHPAAPGLAGDPRGRPGLRTRKRQARRSAVGDADSRRWHRSGRRGAEREVDDALPPPGRQVADGQHRAIAVLHRDPQRRAGRAIRADRHPQQPGSLRHALPGLTEHAAGLDDRDERRWGRCRWSRSGRGSRSCHRTRSRPRAARGRQRAPLARRAAAPAVSRGAGGRGWRAGTRRRRSAGRR